MPNMGANMSRVGQNQCIRFIYGIFGREITKFTVIYGVYIRFWPTLNMCGLANAGWYETLLGFLLTLT